MARWTHIAVGRDRSNRLSVARCLRCGHLVAASKDRRQIDSASANHHCEKRSTFVRPQRRPQDAAD